MQHMHAAALSRDVACSSHLRSGTCSLKPRMCRHSIWAAERIQKCCICSSERLGAGTELAACGGPGVLGCRCGTAATRHLRATAAPAGKGM